MGERVEKYLLIDKEEGFETTLEITHRSCLCGMPSCVEDEIEKGSYI